LAASIGRSDFHSGNRSTVKQNKLFRAPNYAVWLMLDYGRKFAPSFFLDSD